MRHSIALHRIRKLYEVSDGEFVKQPPRKTRTPKEPKTQRAKRNHQKLIWASTDNPTEYVNDADLFPDHEQFPDTKSTTTQNMRKRVLGFPTEMEVDAH